MNKEQFLSTITKEKIIEHSLETDYNIEEVYLIKDDSQQLWGLLYVDSYSEKIDNHCQQCMDEDVFAVKAKLNNDNFYLIANVGSTKLSKIKLNKLKTSFEIIQKIKSA